MVVVLLLLGTKFLLVPGHIPEGTDTTSSIVGSVFVIAIEDYVPYFITSDDLMQTRTSSIENVHHFGSTPSLGVVTQIRQNPTKTLWISADSAANFYEMQFVPTEPNVCFFK